MDRLARYRSRRSAWIVVLTLVAVLVVGFAVAGGARNGVRGDSASAVGPSMVPPGFASGGMDAASPAPAGGKATQAEAAPSTGGATSAAGQPDAPNRSSGVPVGDVGRSLVRTAQLTVEVKDTDAASRQIRGTVAGMGGFVTEERTGTTGSWVVLRVPSDSLDKLVDAVAAVGKPVDRRSQVVDATEQVVDLDARVATQQASVARVRALLAQATSIGDVVSIESELSRREADLDSLTRRLSALRDKVALSSLTVDLRSVGAPAPPEVLGTGGFLGGLAQGWEGLKALAAGAGAAIGFLLPFLAVLAVILVIGWLVRRIVRARRVPAAAAAGAGGAAGSRSAPETGSDRS